MPAYNLREFQTSNIGTQHWYVHQEQRMSCGPACMAMVVKRKFGIEVSDRVMMEYSKAHTQEIYNGKTGVTKNFQQKKYKAPDGTALPTTGYSSADGTEAANLCVMLKKMCINTKPEVSNSIVSLLENASPEQPLICQVEYISPGMNGLKHWVVVDGPVGGKLAVVDPGHGLTEIDYTTQYNDLAGKRAKFTGRHIKIPDAA